MILHIFAIYLKAGQQNSIAPDKLFNGQLVTTVHLGRSLVAAQRHTMGISILSFCYYTSVNLKYAHISPSIAGTSTALTTADLTLMYNLHNDPAEDADTLVSYLIGEKEKPCITQ